MTQNEKDLLLKDLCARLPYGVKCSHKNEDIFSLTCIDLEYNYIYVKHGGFKIGEPEINHKHIKPYLFPLSSMTEEQKQEYTYIVNYISPDDTDNWKEGEFIYVEQFIQLMNFYHRNHLDYRGLIPKGLAIDATGLNIY